MNGESYIKGSAVADSLRFCAEWFVFQKKRSAHVAQLVEHVLGKDEVTGSIPVVGSIYFGFELQKRNQQ